MELVPVDRFDWERWIKRLHLPPTVKLMALTLATYADPDGSRVFPGVEELVAVTCQSLATVKRQMATLRELGLIELVSRASRRAGLADEYRLTVPANVTELPGLPPDHGQDNRAHR
ncbi:helix-turn-helix domain-containing protein [Nocardia sp. NPDC059246]|uniref:helix-turn-helix domain-containing protein n=1 Tax=unclassified Nocardia TaxID=2637762 RepID=UPI0036974119